MKDTLCDWGFAEWLTDPSGTGLFWEKSYIKNGRTIETPAPVYCPDVGMEFTPDHIIETQGNVPRRQFQLYNSNFHGSVLKFRAAETTPDLSVEKT